MASQRKKARRRIAAPYGIRPNRELVVYALYLLGGESKLVHTEDITLKCFELYPASFSWVKYAEYPDKDIVRVALTDARKELYGALVTGRTGKKRAQSGPRGRVPVDDGWTLTSAGLHWIRENEDALQLLAGSREVKTHRQRLLKQLQRIRDHVLFSDFVSRPSDFNPSIGAIADLLRCRVDAEPEIWQARFEKIRSQAEAAGQDDAGDFIARCADAYVRQR